MATCRVCKVDYVRSESQIRYGQYICKPCKAAKDRAYRLKNKDKIQEYFDGRKDIKREYNKEYRKNRDISSLGVRLCKCGAPTEATEAQLRSGDYRCNPCRKSYMDKKNNERANKYSKEFWGLTGDVPEEYKAKARRKVRNEVRSGRMEKPDICSICTSSRGIQAHHEDYDKPLDVVWLCTKCHSKLHQELREEEYRNFKKGR